MPTKTEIRLPTVTPPAAPRLSSAPIVGVRPETPFLHTIAATGERPMTFEATGLPGGLRVDASTGRISGTAPSAGEYAITLRAANAHGSDERPLSLVVGQALALTPPLGWNSYDSFDDSVTEAEVLEQAVWQRDHLQRFGWEYVVVDFRWYDENTPQSDQNAPNNPLVADEQGRLQPALNRFPSAAGGEGFAPLAARIHAMGLKFGIHIMRGIPRQSVLRNAPILGSSWTAADAADTTSICPWNADMFGVKSNAAGKAWYASIFAQYAAWGVDFVKVDDSTYNRTPITYHESDVQLIHDAIVSSGRSMVLSLSPGETPVSAAPHLTKVAELWRMSDDFWDRPGDLDHLFALGARWQIVTGPPGHWPDADMLPLGVLGPRSPVEAERRAANRTRFTPNEQVTMMSYWALLPSPLMLGANLVASGEDALFRALLTNEELLAIHQDALGARGQRVSGTESTEVWVKALGDGRKAVGLFNHAEHDQELRVTWSELGLTPPVSIRDVWQRAERVASSSGIAASVPYRGALLFVVGS